ncbi:peptidase domain-containing ABC transporter [Magnetococcales bacterium HHB-1]
MEAHTATTERIAIGRFNPQSDYARCLIPLLDALGWRGSHAQLFEAFPLDPDHMDQLQFLNVLASLKFTSQHQLTTLDQIDPRLFPCLFIPDGGQAQILIKQSQDQILIFEGESGQFSQIKRQNTLGTVIFFRPISQEQISPLNKQAHWFQNVLTRFYKVMLVALTISFFLSLSSMVAPLFTMIIYDQILAGRSAHVLYLFVVGIGLFFAGDILFRLLRARILSFVSARVGHIAGSEILRRILYLPPLYTETASIGAQVSRVKDLETVREFIAGPGMVALIELPFILILFIGLFLMGGVIVVVPLCAMGLFVLFGLVVHPIVKKRNVEAAEAISKKQRVTVEILSNFRPILYTGTRSYWLERYRQLSSEAAMAVYHSNNMTQLVNVVSMGMMTLTGLATITAGVFLVVDGVMTAGGLMASMLLVLRLLTPLKTGFGLLTQFGRIQKSVLQLNRLMNMPLEHKVEADLSMEQSISGQITFSQVSIRYTRDAHPSLIGVDFKLQQGKTLAIVGHDGAGKSTILKLILGLYPPQVGRILLGRHNIRQIKPSLLRKRVGYAPQDNHFFYGTVAQNLRFSVSSASDLMLERAARQIGLFEEIEALPEGFNTRIGDHNIAKLSASFQRRFTLMRVLLRDSPIMMFDEPERGLNQRARAIVFHTLKMLQQDRTLLIVTHSRRYIELSDRVLWLERGRVKHFGPTEEIAPLYWDSLASSDGNH